MTQSLQQSSLAINGKRMYPYVRPYLGRAILALLLCIPIGSLDAVIAWSLKPYMDMVLLEKSVGDSHSYWIPLSIVLFTVFHGVLNYSAQYLNVWVGTRITNDLKLALYKKLLTFETAYFDRSNSGDVIYRYNNDADQASAGLLANLKTFISRTFSSISLIAVLLHTSWQLAIVAILVLACTFYPMSRMRELIKKVMDQSVISGGQTIAAYNDTFGGNKTIMAYNAQPIQMRKFEAILSTLFRLSIKMTQRSSWLSPLMHIMSSLGVAGTIWYGSHLILSGQLTPGGFVAFISALLMLYTPIKNIGNNYMSVQFSFMAIERVFDLLDASPTIKDSPEAVPLEHIRHGIEFQHVDFSYVDGVPVLKNINLDIKVGQSIALVGNSGGGKSTIANLLPRFYDVSAGSIRIDGKDIRDYTLNSLREQMAVVFQDNFLFAGTIRENVQIGKPDATDEEIMQALDMAFLSDFVNELQDGLSTYIGERGILLSGGQKQRLAIARAFIKNAPVIILDEATSALDNKAEAIVQKAIDNLMKNRTVIVIAHRLSTIKNADKILVINQGEIAESGSHDELVTIEGGAYRALYDAQFKSKEAA